MTNYSITNPFEVFTDTDGEPLENGYIYIGQANLNPITNPIEVFWDSEFNYPAAQPIRTLAGYPSRNGTPGNLFINLGDYSDYSIVIQTKRFELVYSSSAAILGSGNKRLNFVDTYDDLRAITGFGVTVYVRGGDVIGDTGQGMFEFFDGAAPGTYTDDKGISFLPTGGDGSAAWIRQYSGPILMDWYLIGSGQTSTYNGDAIESALSISKEVTFSNGTYPVDRVPVLSNHIIHGSPTLTLDADIYTLATSNRLDWADNLTINGATPETLTFSSLGSITGSAGAWDVPITVASAGSAAVGLFLRLTAASGTGKPEVIEGIWKITDVTGSVISITHTARNASFPTLTISDVTINLITTIINCDDENVFQQYGGNYQSDNIVYEVLNAIALDGTKAFAVAPRANASENYYANASAKFGSFIGFSGGGNHGIVVGGTGWVECEANVCACGNNQDGFHATEGASMFAKFCIASGNDESGVMSEMNADIECDGVHACSNGDHGCESLAGKMGLSQNTSILSYNVLRGLHAQDGAIVRANSITCDFNEDAGMKAETGAIIIATNAICDNNANEGFFATRFTYIDASDSTSTNNTTGYRAERRGWIDALGTITVSGNATDYDTDFDGHVSFALDDFEPKDFAGWIDFATAPQFEGVAAPTYVEQTGEYKVTQRNVFWKIKLEYSGLDTADISTVVISGMPVTMAGRNGNVQLNIRSLTGIVMAATDTYQANYNSANDRIVFIDNAGNLMTYNGGEMQAAGIIEIAGWYES